MERREKQDLLEYLVIWVIVVKKVTKDFWAKKAYQDRLDPRVPLGV